MATTLSNPLGQPPLLTGGQKTVRRYEKGIHLDYPHERVRNGRGVQLSVDWYSITMHSSLEVPVDVLQIQLAASLALGCENDDWVETATGAWGYERGLVGPGQARIWWGAPGRDDMHLSFPGQACQIAGEKGLRSLFRYCLGHGGKATRCDVAIDDYRRVVSPADVLKVIQGPDSVTHARKWLVQQGGDVGSSDLTGETAYLGSPKSRQRLRVYDKGLESLGEIDAVRWELESREEAAETMVSALACGHWGQVMSARLVGFVDFRDYESHSEVEKRHRLGWFQQLVGLINKASAYLPKVPRTAEEVVEWLDRSIGPMLAVSMAYWKGDIGQLYEIIERGKRRWRARHKAMVGPNAA